MSDKQIQINPVAMSSEFEAIKHFVTNNLSHFKTKKLENRKFIVEIINELSSGNITTKEQVIGLLKRSQSNMPQKSVRLLSLLFAYRKEIENLALYKEMNISNIMISSENPKQKSSNSAKGLIDFILSSTFGKGEQKLTQDLLRNNIAELRNMAIVVVHGNIESNGNIYGHTLLYLGNLGYLHISALASKPILIPPHEFRNYLESNKSFVINVQPIFEDKSNLSEQDLEKVAAIINEHSNKRWLWLVTHHNCLSFAQKVTHQCSLQVGKEKVMPDSLVQYHDGNSREPIAYAMRADQSKSSSSYTHTSPVLRYMLWGFHTAHSLSGAARQVVKNFFLSEHYNYSRIVANKERSSIKQVSTKGPSRSS